MVVIPECVDGDHGLDDGVCRRGGSGMAAVEDGGEGIRFRFRVRLR